MTNEGQKHAFKVTVADEDDGDISDIRLLGSGDTP